jgi:hypothetical protein
MKKAVQKTKYSKSYSEQRKYSDIVSKTKHRFSRVRNPCFKSISRSQRSVRTSRGRFGGRFDSTNSAIGRGKDSNLAIGRGKDLTRVQGYLRTAEGKTSLTFWLPRTTSNNKSIYRGRNSQAKIFSRKRNQNKRFGSKINKNKSYKKNHTDNFSKLPSRRYKLTSTQKKNIGKILLPYFGKQIV